MTLPSQENALSRGPRRAAGFSLIEMLTAAVVFMILGVLIAQLLSSATVVTGLSNKAQAADAEARLVLGRMGLDFGKMLRRADVEYSFQKQAGNDRLAFVSEVPGYYPAAASPGALSVVSYRMGEVADGFKGLERFSQGLSWLHDSSGEPPAIFRRPIGEFSPEALATAESDEYEEAGPGVLRFEYFFLLKNGDVSDVPWDTGAGHSKTDGLRDVAAVCVVMAVVDPSVLGRVSADDMEALAARLPDFSPGAMKSLPDLEAAWQQTVNADDFSRKSGGSVRIHTRCFPLDS